MTTASLSSFHRDRYRHRYTYPEMVEVYALALRALPTLKANKRLGVLPADFIERIMLAVTEVNGCAVCSYAHATWALEAGIDADEVAALLAGAESPLPPEQATAVAFGQHYAERNGHPDRAAHAALAEAYGPQQTPIIVAAVQVMMAGNVSGLPVSAFLARLKGAAYANSTLAYELIGIPSPILFMPAVAAWQVTRGRRLGPERIVFAD